MDIKPMLLWHRFLVTVMCTGRLSVLACCSQEELFQATEASPDVCLSQMEAFSCVEVSWGSFCAAIITLRWWTELFIFNVQILFSKASFLASRCYCLHFAIFQRFLISFTWYLSIHLSSMKIKQLLHLIWRQFSSRSTWPGERDVRWKSSFTMKDVKVVQGRNIWRIAVILLIP